MNDIGKKVYSKGIGQIQSDPLTINLNGNKLKLANNGKWQLESSELEIATLEIEKLISEKEEMANALEKSMQQVDAFTKEIKEINQMKTVILEMVCFYHLLLVSDLSLIRYGFNLANE
jgi:hypothetical protein